MRILTVMSGVVLAATGAGCLAYYSSAFSSIAFVLGIVMILSANFLIGAFLLSAKNRLPDTVLVEGMMTLIFGFVILNNEVAETIISMFFGSWLVVCGIIRFSQSLSVSRFDPKNWNKIMPLGILSAIFGFIMLLHSLTSSWNQLTLVGFTFILNGFSQLIYAMYMVNHATLPQAEQARLRVEAKQKIAEEKRKERDALRLLSKKEREEKEAEIKNAQKKSAFLKKQELKEQKEKERLEQESLSEANLKLAEEEKKKEEEIKEALAIAKLEEQEEKVAAMQTEKTPESEPKHRTDPVISWDSLSKEPSWEHALRKNDKNGIPEEIKQEEGKIDFAHPKKPDITEILEKNVPIPEPASFKPLNLEEIIEEEALNKIKENQKAEKENDKRFTEEFSWDWPEKK